MPQPGRAINPITGDYIMGVDGRLQGVGQVPQLVQLAITTTLGSSVLGTLGQTLDRIQEKGPNFQQQVRSALSAAMAPLTGQNLMRIESIFVTEYPNNPDAGFGEMRWSDLTTGIQYTTPLGQ